MGEVIAIIFLGVLCAGLIVERHLYAKEMNQRLSECVKAVMSRNIGEFLQATKPQEKTEEPFVENDEVLLEEASDKEFDKALGIK